MTEHGDQGEQGVPGERGPTGDTGEQGATGPTGPIGYYGPAGLPGERGRVGDHGQPGAQGETGSAGETGAAGADAPGSRRNIIIVVAIIAALALPFGWAVQRMFATTADLQAATAQLEAAQTRDDCFAAVLTGIVEANAEATELSAQTSLALREYVAAAVDGKVALADAFTLVLTDASDEEKIAALENAAAAIRTASEVGGAYDQLSTELAETRRDHPTPTVADINACR